MRVAGDDGQDFGSGLSDQQPIEGGTMMERESGNALAVFGACGQPLDAIVSWPQSLFRLLGNPPGA